MITAFVVLGFVLAAIAAASYLLGAMLGPHVTSDSDQDRDPDHPMFPTERLSERH